MTAWDEATVERMARAAYEDWIADVQDLEEPWDALPESHRDRLRCSMSAALAVLPASQSSNKLTEDKLRAALEHPNELVALAALAVANIEDEPNWLDSTPLITAHAHANVLLQDLPSALAASQSSQPTEGDVERMERAHCFADPCIDCLELGACQHRDFDLGPMRAALAVLPAASQSRWRELEAENERLRAKLAAIRKHQDDLDDDLAVS